MNVIKKILISLGILLLIYSVFGRFYGRADLGFFGMVRMQATSVVTFVNSLLLLAILINQNKK